MFGDYQSFEVNEWHADHGCRHGRWLSWYHHGDLLSAGAFHFDRLDWEEDHSGAGFDRPAWFENVEAKQIRAEEVKKQFDFVTGRAVKNLPEFFMWIKNNVRRGEKNTIPNGVLYWKGGEMDDELEVLGIRPRKVINLEETFTDPYFEQKYILHFDARDVQRARKPPRVEQ